MRSRLIRIISMFLLTITLSFFSVSSFSFSEALTTSDASRPEGRTIRVAQIDLSNFYDYDKYGPIGGYGFEYLEEISNYTGWNYEYIPVTWEHGLEMLENGEVDLFAPVPAIPEIQDRVELSNQQAGMDYSVLCVPAEQTETAANDFSAFNGMKVGYLKNNVSMTGLAEYEQSNHFKVDAIPYDNQAILLKELHSGAVDAILTGSLEMRPTERIVAKFAPTPFYFAAAKGNHEILDPLNRAMDAIKQENPYFDYELQKKYYDLDEYAVPLFTEEEKEYIKNAGVIKTVYDPAWAPIEYYDEASGTFRGINADIFAQISEMTGLQFRFIRTDSYTEALNQITSGRADVLTGIDEDTPWANQHHLKLSDSYLIAPIVMIKNTKATHLDTATIAVAKDYLAAGEYVRRSSPNAKIQYYDTAIECLEAVNDGKADITYANSYVAEKQLENPRLNKLEIVETVNLADHLCIGVSDQMDPLLLSILNKSIHGITDAQLNNIIFKHTISETPALTLEYLLYRNPSVLLAILFVLFLGTTAVMMAVIIIKNKHNREIKKIAYQDSLTGAWNYSKFKIEAPGYLRNARQRKYAIIYLDIHKFSYFNDTFGYSVGDMILQEVSKELDLITTEYECYARLAADNFALLLEYDSDEAMIQRGMDFQRRCDERLSRINNRYQVHFTSAICKVAPGETDIPALVGKADIAHKTIGDIHKASIVIYDDKIQAEFLRKKKLESYMTSSLENEDFQVYLQPKIDLHDGTISGTEALARWQHPTDGMIMPSEFIPLFESNGFILELDFYVYEKVCQLLRKWLDAGEIVMPVSVNVSKVHLSNSDFSFQLLTLINRYHIPPALLELEMTESMLFENPKEAIAMVRGLKNLGFPILIDDFGSGYSALNLLKDLTVDVLKLDKEFFRKDGMEEKDKIIVGGIIRIARDLHMKILSEGVETQEQVDYLTAAGCHLVQGYFFAKPMPVPEFEKMAGYQV